MLQHACGYALANAGHDTRQIRDWLLERQAALSGLLRLLFLLIRLLLSTAGIEGWTERAPRLSRTPRAAGRELPGHENENLYRQ